MKSLEDSVLAVYEGVLTDASNVWQTSRRSFGRDSSHLRRYVKARGLAFLTLTLPAVGKVLDSALASGRVQRSDFPQGIKLRGHRPELFGSLWLLVFDTSGYVLPEADIEAVIFLRQLCFMAKKLRIDCKQISKDIALDEFYSIESSMQFLTRDFWHEAGDRVDPDILQGFRWRKEFPHFIPFCRKVLSQIKYFDPWELTGKHGPGAVSEPYGSSKYEFRNWPEKLDRVMPYDWYASGLLDGPFEYEAIEHPSRMIMVPKTQKGPRIICAEPSAHQWAQQAVRLQLEKSLDETILSRYIRFQDQQRSRDGALRASLDGSLATIDLSSASDRLSADLVYDIFEGTQFLEYFRATRSTNLVQNLTDQYPRVTVLRKFAPMGSSLTFPVQSIVYALISLFAESHHADFDIDEGRGLDVAVFGDDIILPERSFSLATTLLGVCGLKVNESKSYSRGLFRESCGMDAWRGVDVTPSYFLEPYDGSATATASTVAMHNNFHSRGLFHAAATVVGQLPEKERKLFPLVAVGGGALGLVRFLGYDYSHLAKRYDESLQVDKYRVLTVDARPQKVRGTGFSELTQYFTERPDPELYWESGQVQRVVPRKRTTWIDPVIGSGVEI